MEEFEEEIRWEDRAHVVTWKFAACGVGKKRGGKRFFPDIFDMDMNYGTLEMKELAGNRVRGCE